MHVRVMANGDSPSVIEGTSWGYVVLPGLLVLFVGVLNAAMPASWLVEKQEGGEEVAVKDKVWRWVNNTQNLAFIYEVSSSSAIIGLALLKPSIISSSYYVMVLVSITYVINLLMQLRRAIIPLSLTDAEENVFKYQTLQSLRLPALLLLFVIMIPTIIFMWISPGVLYTENTTKITAILTAAVMLKMSWDIWNGTPLLKQNQS